MKNSILVSRILEGIRAKNKDSRISKRYVLEVATSKAIFLMAQKFRDRSLFRESNIYTTVECFDMVPIDKFKCDVVEFKSCNTLMKSTKPLPPLIYTRYGSSLKEVTNIDYSKQFIPSTPSQYRRDKRRQSFKKDNYFIIRDNYLFFPDSTVEAVTLYLYTPNTYEAKKVSSCEENKCLNPWDFEFVCSDKLLDIVVQETIKEVSFRLQIPQDENPNMDTNQISKTTN